MTCPTRSKPSKKNPSQAHKDKKTSENNSKNKNATKSLVTFFICKDINEYQNYHKRKQIFTKKIEKIKILYKILYKISYNICYNENRNSILRGKMN